MARIVGQVPPLWASYWASDEYLKYQGGLLYFWFALTYSNTSFQRSQLQAQVLSATLASAAPLGLALQQRVHAGRLVRVRALHDSDFAPVLLDRNAEHGNADERGRVDWDWDAADAQNAGVAYLRFARGDEFIQVQSLDEARSSLVNAAPVFIGWCEGWAHGRRGFFPRSYVVALTDSANYYNNTSSINVDAVASSSTPTVL